jgi:hypothetical protein
MGNGNNGPVGDGSRALPVASAGSQWWSCCSMSLCSLSFSHADEFRKGNSPKLQSGKLEGDTWGDFGISADFMVAAWAALTNHPHWRS